MSIRLSAAPRCSEVRWLSFVDTYQTMCVASRSRFRRLLEEIREARLAA